MKKSIKLLLSLIVILGLISGCSNKENSITDDTFTILSSSEYKDVEPMLLDYAKSQGFHLRIEYSGTIDMMEMLNDSPEEYDAIWFSNSIWMYMLENQRLVKNSKFISINPVVFGIKKSKAERLGFVGKEQIYMKDIIQAIHEESLSFIMPSATQTNSGASMYLSIISALSNQEQSSSFMLNQENLASETLQEELKTLFSHVVRSSGDEVYALEIYKNNTQDYDVVINYESNILMLNEELVGSGEEPLYLIYPYDGVSLSDSPFGYLDHGIEKKEKQFNTIQEYLLSDKVQEYLMQTGRRVHYGGLIESQDSTLYKEEWGVYSERYLTTNRYPSAEIIKNALNLYQETLKRPSHIVFCLDYSGSMMGEGNRQLLEAMEFILNNEEASASFIQFSKNDIISIIPFSTYTQKAQTTYNGVETEELLKYIHSSLPSGATNIYQAVEDALTLLNETNQEEYNCSIVLMTDGMSNKGSFEDVSKYYAALNSQIPVYSITFGEADESELEALAKLTNGKVFDGGKSLKKTFKEIRGYN